MRVLSMGGGVQSSAVFFMSIRGEIPAYDAVVFADTGWEPRKVYEWLGFLEEEARKVGLPFIRVSSGNIREDALRRIRESTRWATMPLVVEGSTGLGRLQRQCTQEYKVKPIRAWIRQALKEREEKVALLSLGISWDEVERMKPSEVQYIVHQFPLGV
jgi:3'-phosphoadenosine 5'-phosphosulfate sulfotransferase (PAPS reductase)/FAD synthetase